MLDGRTATDDEMQSKLRYLGPMAALCVAAGGNAAAKQPADAAAGDPAAAAAKLAEVRGRIAEVTRRLSADLQQRDALGARLRDAELAVTALRRHLDELRTSELAAERRRARLRAAAVQVQAELDTQRAALAAEVRAAFMIGRQEELKLLLNQRDPAIAGRMAVFYGYLARERAKKIAAIDAQAAHLKELLDDIETATAKLRALEAQTAGGIADLEQARRARAAALVAAGRRVDSASEELARLQREAQAEESLLADLARVLQDFPVDSRQQFATLRGKLPWPVAGRVAAAGPGPHRNGVFIQATPGAKVRAAYYGRVVYADWLQGLGLLIIIGHDGDYMTLYGHAEVLYKSVGDWVAPGEVIASLADAGGSPPQLYFEIREGRAPKDARSWLRSGP